MPATQSRANARQGRAHAVAIDTDGWVDLLWEGRWQHSDGPEAATAEDITNVLGNLQTQANAEGESWPGVVFYVGHPEIDGTLASAPAKAWAKQFRINAQGRLQGLVEWAGDSRAELIDSRAYKYLSCYEWGDLDEDGVFHPATISSVGLTNAPVKRDGQKPLANAGDSAMPDETPPLEALAALGLAPRPNAISDEIAARIAALIGSAEDKEAALDLVYKELRRVWEEERQLDAVATLVGTMANAAGTELPEGDLQARGNAVAEAVQRVVAAVSEMGVTVGFQFSSDDLTERANAMAYAMKTLVEERTAGDIREAISAGTVPDTDEGRANARRLLKADREAAKAHFANAVPGSTGHAPRATDPLLGKRPQRANAIEEPAGVAKDTQAQANAIQARANALMPECGGNWDVAWQRACKEVTAEAVQ